ncbi:DinB family protein [Nocardioides sp. TF02-7]|uniref:DinB family protein n=1 Tax=Nocardioides sp. TF02-7 TaxID=2917724 RepID=UPI001F05E51E|nr:DinB family protein [Nocardioides sp. TF02-7]UMG92680.1 DinB family protein [Nocardioides sp. TF02-7]
MSSPSIEPDTKDWTWVLDRPCPDCGYDASTVEPARLGTLVRDNAERWQQVLASPDATSRPQPTVWSPTEYAAHVRDVHRVFAGRITLMLGEDGPRFPNWDQDETAVAERYDLLLPDRVGAELLEEAERVASSYDGVTGDAWERHGLRSDGSRFTVASLGRYHLHDVVHHLWDVRWVHGAERGGA